MQGVGKCRIEFGPKADQAGSGGCGQFENARELGRRLEQVAPVARLGAGFAAAGRKSGARVAERLQKKPDIRVTDVLPVIAEQP